MAQPIPQGTIVSRVGRRAQDWIPAVVVFGLGIAAWQWLIPDVFHVQRFLLPRFSAVMSTFWHERGTLWSAGWFTFKEAVAGFALGCSVALAIAVVLSRWKRVGGAFMPYAIAANAIPIIAFAPITNAWFGLLSPWSKIVIAAVLCFFPVLVNALRGLTSVDPESLELMRSYAASERAVYRRVRIPTSLPFVFTALKVASVLAMIGAVVGDYFGGSTRSLGVQVQSSVSLSQFETAWAAILVASILGIAFYTAIAVVERFALAWHPSTRGASE
ncbi:MAG TPA: ABC transporter permease [Gaiellaceae bacterium]